MIFCYKYSRRGRGGFGNGPPPPPPMGFNGMPPRGGPRGGFMRGGPPMRGFPRGRGMGRGSGRPFNNSQAPCKLKSFLE